MPLNKRQAAAFQAAGWRGTSQEALRSIARKYADVWSIMREVAGNPCTPEDVLTSLVEHHISNVRVAIAGNRKAPAELLQRLALDDEWMVKWALTQNPTTPSKILVGFVSDEDEDSRVSDAAHGKLAKRAARRHI